MVSYDVAFVPSDEKSHREVLARIHAAWCSGERPPAQPRPVIEQSWLRMKRSGVNPAKEPAEIADRPSGEDAPILAVLPLVKGMLEPLLDDDVLLVLADERGTVQWRGGGRKMMQSADRLAFQPGRRWSEQAVGTNAIGTALSAGIPVHVHAAEHFCISHHGWSCAAAPVVDPRSGRPLGVIDLSFPVGEANPMAVALVASIARQIGVELKETHRRELRRMAASARTPAAGQWALVDHWGWVAASGGIAAADRIRLPGMPLDGFSVDGLGLVRAEPLHGGWLLRPAASSGTSVQLELTLSAHRCWFTIRGSGAETIHELQGRRASVVSWLADHSGGVSGRELAEAIYGRPDALAAVRAEISRINRELGTVVHSRPYRLAESIQVIDRRM
ncbi:GAF domain-containing protein [Brooklawnia sp.]|uniref:GAF domain-containing protein n=1 Tax=Brooklawnia sp. TaxID=2699740 RepID=UPI00311F71C1